MVTNWSETEWQKQLTSLEQILASGQSIKQAQGVVIIGFGEISTILQFQQQPHWVIKRMPIFDTDEQANRYLQNYLQYTMLLREAGLNIPLSSELIIGNNPVTLYILQTAFPAERIASNALRTSNFEQQKIILQQLIQEIEKVFTYNLKYGNDYLLSCDGQASNWAIAGDKIHFIDTSTPLFKKDNLEQLEYDLLLKSTPCFLRGIIRCFFLDDILERYYKKSQVYIDLIANLQKEQLGYLIPHAIQLVNPYLDKQLSEKIVTDYYRQDKITWQVFLAFRKFDRWMHKYLWHKPYQYILPEKVHR